MVFLASKQIMSGVWNRITFINLTPPYDSVYSKPKLILASASLLGAEIQFIDLTPPHYSVYSKPKLILASASSFIISRFKNLWFAADF